MNIVISGGGETHTQAAGTLHRLHSVSTVSKDKTRGFKEHQVL